MLRGMVAKLVVGENRSRHHVGSHVKSSTSERASDQASCGHKSITSHPRVARSRSEDCRPPVRRSGPGGSRSCPLQARSRRCGRPRFDTPTAQVRRKLRPVRANSGTMTPSGHPDRYGRTKPVGPERKLRPVNAAAEAAKQQCQASWPDRRQTPRCGYDPARRQSPQGRRQIAHEGQRSADIEIAITW